ncbi:hypothetical protein ATCV1_z644R [Acanthocystis turfacea chlorella virus 1]|uniref:Uncharacterized protein z644R n=1 Tax=Chlorovirus heliozoae TaxID=322019 RepID=A7K9Q4_9PHYC|nr:hypothetical protein ATCV1_z644R [Acanthocystis turfacea chlorella virus 1]ABT16778.1 hypothetical protein ATCV1_z644R [Acanthocystis turfacea chlorella virus 1]
MTSDDGVASTNPESFGLSYPSLARAYVAQSTLHSGSDLSPPRYVAASTPRLVSSEQMSIACWRRWDNTRTNFPMSLRLFACAAMSWFLSGMSQILDINEL